MEGKHWVRLCDFLLYKPRQIQDAFKIKGSELICINFLKIIFIRLSDVDNLAGFSGI